jgi:hypothetical protein
MNALLQAVVYCVAIVNSLSAPAPTPATPRLSPRVADAVSTIHGVWYSKSEFLPLYVDQGLLEYLDTIPSGLAVLPVMAPEPIHFRRGQYLFISTGFLLEASGERELLDAVSPRGPQLISFADDAIFRGVQDRLASQISGYEDNTRRRLRRR